MQPDVSVVIVSDYAGGKTKSWDDLRAALAALSRQDYRGSVEYLLLESAQFKYSVPADIAEILPHLQIVFSNGTSSYQLKNHGAQLASAEIVAFLDADCTPSRHWLAALAETMRKNPQAVAVSGKTVYPGRTLLERILALTGRTYLNRSKTDKTWSISNNNAAIRKNILKRFPLSEEAGPFGAKLHAHRIIKDGNCVLYEPRMEVVHDIEGWAMERDVRRNVGYATITMRRVEPSLPLAWVANLSYLSIPLFFIGRVLLTWWLCLRFFSDYRVAWYELPLALTAAVAIHIMEIPGMVCAIRGQPIQDTAYR